MVNLSQPMSFPAAAMAALDAVDSRTASTQSNQPDSNDVAVGSSKVTPQKNGVSSATLKEPNGTATHDEFELDEDGTHQRYLWKLHAHSHHTIGYDSFDDFCLVPSSADDSPATTRLKKENKLLKSKLEAIEKQMASVRRQITLRNEQDQHLRDNIALARKEVRMLTYISTGSRRASNRDVLGTTCDGGVNFICAIGALDDESNRSWSKSSSAPSTHDRSGS